MQEKNISDKMNYLQNKTIIIEVKSDLEGTSLNESGATHTCRS